MNLALKQNFFPAPTDGLPEITAIIFVGPTKCAKGGTIDELRQTSEYSFAFRPDHALNLRYLDDHIAFLDALDDPPLLLKYKNRIREDLPSHGHCFFFLPSLAAVNGAKKLGPLTDALLECGFAAVEMILATVEPQAHQELTDQIKQLEWKHPLKIRNFEDLPALNAKIRSLNAENLRSYIADAAVALVAKLMTSEGLSINEARCKALIRARISTMEKNGVELQFENRMSVANLVARIHCVQSDWLIRHD